MVALFSLSTSISYVDSNGYVSTKYGYITLAVAAQLVSIVVFLTYFLNFDKSKFCSSLSFIVSLMVDYLIIL
jgi:hypothetical protein